MPLEKELETYHIKLPDLLQEAGNFVVISGDEVAGSWPTYDEALEHGYDLYAFRPFLVKRIQVLETPRVLLHHILPKCQG